jgi:DNA-binding LacI/PurR family transcriptional regulator
MKRLTMKQIGELVGVSQSTVSRVLNGAPMNVPVAPETRARILRTVADLGYTPNPVARALRSARTNLLGLIVRDINDPFFGVAVATISAEAHRHGYGVVLGHADSSAHEALALSKALAMGHCEGAILVGDLRDQSAFWMDAGGRQMAFVGLWQGRRAPELPVVNVDNFEGIRLAVEHVVALEHRRIAFVQGGKTGDGLERREAFRTTMVDDVGMSVPDRYQIVVTNEFMAAAAAVEPLLCARSRPTAIVASTDVAAIGTLKAASRAGLSVPRDLSVVGFDDIPLAQIMVPSLTTVQQPMEELSRRAVAQLLDLIGGAPTPLGHVEVIAPRLVVRDSTAHAPATSR